MPLICHVCHILFLSWSTSFFVSVLSAPLPASTSHCPCYCALSYFGNWLSSHSLCCFTSCPCLFFCSLWSTAPNWLFSPIFISSTCSQLVPCVFIALFYFLWIVKTGFSFTPVLLWITPLVSWVVNCVSNQWLPCQFYSCLLLSAFGSSFWIKHNA